MYRGLYKGFSKVKNEFNLKYKYRYIYIHIIHDINGEILIDEVFN